MFVDIVVVLAGMESSIFLLDEEEGRGLWGVGQMDLSGEYKLFFAFFCMHLVDNQEIVFLVMLWCLNVL